MLIDECVCKQWQHALQLTASLTSFVTLILLCGLRIGSPHFLRGPQVFLQLRGPQFYTLTTGPALHVLHWVETGLYTLLLAYISDSY